MKVFAGTPTHMPMRDVPAHVQRVERMGYDGIKVPETVHNGFLTAMLAAEHSSNLEVVTSILLAFPRSPMITAISAWDVQAMSGGRFCLGLGTQVKGNIEGRYSTPWVAPVQRMREVIQSLRAIWQAFQNGTDLKYHGEHYNFTRLQPRFNPGPIEHPDIPLLIGAVGPAMCRLAGAECDGMITHPSNSVPRYLEEFTKPQIAEGAKRKGRDLEGFRFYMSNMFATGATADEVSTERERLRYSLGFYFSTPPYWPTIELLGRGELGPKLRQMTREGKWGDLATMIDDEILDAIVPAATYDEIADVLREWYGDSAYGLGFPVPENPKHDKAVEKAIERLRA
jgi:probable F420-dependent oxidoreductase